MLLIGDIHINTRYKNQIIDTIKAYIQNNPEEKNIIFLGDFVYHFSYDRAALLLLYDLFIDLYVQGKYVYILAGNHDWLGNTFVFEEAQKAFNILNERGETRDEKSFGSIKFITEPRVEEIEGEKILFLPYMIDGERMKQLANEDIKGGKIERGMEWKFIDELLASENKNQQLSGTINQLLYDYVQQYDRLTVIHHYYINNTKFPGQKSRFSFKDLALSEQFLDQIHIKMISGHLHQPFVHKNYLCTGSVRSTSPLEINQLKGLFQYDIKSNKVVMDIVSINPYMNIELSKEKSGEEDGISYDALSKESLQKAYQNIGDESKKALEDSSVWNVGIHGADQFDLSTISLNLQVDKIDYDNIEQYVDENVLHGLKDVKLKKPMSSVKDLLEDFDVSTKNLATGFGDRKYILKSYLQKKYPDDHETYELFLRELKLL